MIVPPPKPNWFAIVLLVAAPLIAKRLAERRSLLWKPGR
jgi:hypothetical protein